MISYNLNTVDAVKKLVGICDKYDVPIDVTYQRQVVDGRSIIGVASLMGHMVGLDIITDDEKIKEQFRKDVEG